MRRGYHLIVALIGAALFVWVIARVGCPAILHQARAMRVTLPIVLSLSLCRLLLQTAAWSGALNCEGISAKPGRLIGTRLASEGMGYLTFLGAVLSEPLKIKLLRTPLESTITATFLDNGIYWCTCVLVAIGGCICAAVGVSHGAHFVANVAALALLTLGLVLIVRRKPILSEIVRIAGPRSPSWLIRGEAIEKSIRDSRLSQPKLVGRMFWTGVACQALLVAEVAVVMWSLRLPIHVVTVLAVDGITRALRMVSGWVPARLGADEGGAMSAFMMAGFSPVSGLALALTRRLRDLLWAFIGLAWLLWTRHKSGDENCSKDALSPIA